jgi:hypothetical protein
MGDSQSDAVAARERALFELSHTYWRTLRFSFCLAKILNKQSYQVPIAKLASFEFV